MQHVWNCCKYFDGNDHAATLYAVAAAAADDDGDACDADGGDDNAICDAAAGNWPQAWHFHCHFIAVNVCVCVYSQ